MPATTDSPQVTGLEFHYDDSPQDSPQWLAVKRGRIGASGLYKWLAVSKSKATPGKPLKARLDYEKELMFERQFNVSFEHYMNSAMQDGKDFEEWAAEQYEQQTKVRLERVGCWYNEFFAASPDRKRVEQPAGVEIKILKDNSFLEVLDNKKVMQDNGWEVIEKLADSSSVKKHWTQIQGQLWATSWEYVDYAPVNFNSGQLAIIRIKPSPTFHEYLALSVQEQLVVDKFNTDNIYPIIGEIPQFAKGDGEVGDGGW